MSAADKYQFRIKELPGHFTVQRVINPAQWVDVPTVTFTSLEEAIKWLDELLNPPKPIYHPYVPLALRGVVTTPNQH